MNNYFLKWLPTHLAEIKDEVRLAELLTNDVYRDNKLQAGFTNILFQDFEKWITLAEETRSKDDLVLIGIEVAKVHLQLEKDFPKFLRMIEEDPLRSREILYPLLPYLTYKKRCLILISFLHHFLFNSLFENNEKKENVEKVLKLIETYIPLKDWDAFGLSRVEYVAKFEAYAVLMIMEIVKLGLPINEFAKRLRFTFRNKLFLVSSDEFSVNVYNDLTEYYYEDPSGLRNKVRVYARLSTKYYELNNRLKSEKLLTEALNIANKRNDPDCYYIISQELYKQNENELANKYELTAKNLFAIGEKSNSNPKYHKFMSITLEERENYLGSNENSHINFAVDDSGWGCDTERSPELAPVKTPEEYYSVLINSLPTQEEKLKYENNESFYFKLLKHYSNLNIKDSLRIIKERCREHSFSPLYATILDQLYGKIDEEDFKEELSKLTIYIEKEFKKIETNIFEFSLPHYLKLLILTKQEDKIDDFYNRFQTKGGQCLFIYFKAEAYILLDDKLEAERILNFLYLKISIEIIDDIYCLKSRRLLEIGFILVKLNKMDEAFDIFIHSLSLAKDNTEAESARNRKISSSDFRTSAMIRACAGIAIVGKIDLAWSEYQSIPKAKIADAYDTALYLAKVFYESNEIEKYFQIVDSYPDLIEISIKEKINVNRIKAEEKFQSMVAYSLYMNGYVERAFSILNFDNSHWYSRSAFANCIQDNDLSKLIDLVRQNKEKAYYPTICTALIIHNEKISELLPLILKDIIHEKKLLTQALTLYGIYTLFTGSDPTILEKLNEVVEIPGMLKIE